MKLGDGLLCLAMLVWISIAVGPWWVGLLLFVSAGIINYAMDRL